MFLKAHDKTALIWQNQTITYSELLQNIQHLGQNFNKSNYKHIVIFAENRPEWVYAFYAAWKLNAVVIPIDFMSSAGDVSYILNDCQPELILHSKQTQKVLKQALSIKPISCEQINLDQHNFPQKAITEATFPKFDKDKTAVIIYTSGTTGNPKGVMLSFNNLLANIEAVSQEIPIYTSNDRVMVLLPLHHIFPLVGSMVAPLSMGGSIYFCPSMASEDLMATLQNNGITIVIGVPRLYSLISKSIQAKIQSSLIAKTLFALAETVDSLAFSRKLFNSVQQKFGGQVRYLVSGGAKLEEETAHILRVLGFEVLEGYGMTEAAPMITFTRPGEVLIGSAGKPMSCNQVKSLNGEIVAKGRNIMQGYYNLSEETAETLRDGWLHTGDLGYLDADSNIHITGRKKEIIVLSNGKNISPVEIEHKLMAMTPAIAEVGVYLHNDLLQVVIYPDFSLLRRQQISNPEAYFREQIITSYNESVTPYKKLMRVHILAEELPKTRLGKLKRFMLHTLEEINQYKKHNSPAPDYEEYSAISDFLAQQVDKDIYASDHLELDLGLDSLDRVSFQTFLKATFGVKVTEEILNQHPTVEKISAYIKDTKKHIKISVSNVVEWAEILKEQVDSKLPNSWVLHNPIKNLFAGLLKLYFKLSAKGLENLPQSPFILAPNHQSYLDGLFIASFLSNPINKETYFFAKAKHVKNTWLKFLADQNNIIVVNVEDDLKTSIQKLSEVLKQGKNIIIFPEGTRTKSGSLGSFKKTFAILSRELNIPVVPVAIDGAYAALPSGSILPKPQQAILVSFLPPLWPENKSYEAISSRVRKAVSTALQ